MGIIRKLFQTVEKKPVQPVFLVFFLLLLIFLRGSILPAEKTANASSNLSFGGPTREITVTSTRTTSHWKLVRWSNGVTVCNMFLEHDQWPSVEDVIDFCGEKVWEEWRGTPVCRNATLGRDPSKCKGLFLRFIERSTHDYTEVKELPGIQVELSTPACTPGSWCGTRPVIEITATEPIEGFYIERVHLVTDYREIIFDGGVGHYILPETDHQGGNLDYWVESSYGDNTYRLRVKYRSVVSDDGNAWRFDLLAEKWAVLLPPGSFEWSIFTEVDEPLPLVLQQPLVADELNTSKTYLFLTGYLIQAGLVDASNCDDGGLTTAGLATRCGETAGMEQTIAWQNKYDDQILAAAHKYNVPARLLKGIIASESQFWPESYSAYERGLGFITDNGADLVLKWNTPYYLQVCQPIYGESVCFFGFDNLVKIQKDILRRMVLDKVGTVDEIEVLAASLLASAHQSGQIVKNQSGREIAGMVSYVDMWKITAANYYAGSGCMGDAITDLLEDGGNLTWDNITSYLSFGCNRADGYVRQSFGD